MGPRIFIRGYLVVAAARLDVLGPSMGPRIFIRGYVANVDGKKALLVLQWGRGFSSADTAEQPRGVHVMECFNGAADFHPRIR